MVKKPLPHQLPSIETRRLVLRPLSLKDTAAVYRIYSDSKVVKYIMEPLSSIADAEKMLRELVELFECGKGMFWAVTLKENGEFIGTCSFEKFSAHAGGEVGFDLALAWWGQGLMGEALRAVIRYGFETLALKEISAITSVENRRAITLLKRMGFEIVAEKELDYHLALKRKTWNAAIPG